MEKRVDKKFDCVTRKGDKLFYKCFDSYSDAYLYRMKFIFQNCIFTFDTKRKSFEDFYDMPLDTEEKLNDFLSEIFDEYKNYMMIIPHNKLHEYYDGDIKYSIKEI